MNTTKILSALALGASLTGASLAPRTAFAHGNEHGKAHKDQKITVSIDGQGFHPAMINVKAGQEVHMTFVSKDASCANNFSIPALKQTISLKKGQKEQIVFTAKKGQTINFACKMGMAKGMIMAK